MKRFIAIILCLMMILCSCGEKSNPTSATVVEKEKAHAPLVDSWGKYEFYTPKSEDFVYIAEFADFVKETGLYPRLYMINGLSASDDYEITDVATNYHIVDMDTSEKYMTFSIKHAPQSEIDISRMDTTYFTVENYYNGQKRSTVEDFGNTLLNDSIGIIETPHGNLNACYIEFENKLTNCDSIRFYLANDQINANYYGIMITADVPLENQQQIIAIRNCLGSLCFSE